MNRSFLVIALATLLAIPAQANDFVEGNLVAVNNPAFAAVAASTPVTARPATTTPAQPLLQPLLDQMARDLAGKVDQQVSSSLSDADR